MYSCVAVASISISATGILTRSPNGDETDQPVSFHHGHGGGRRVVISDISWLIVSASRAVTLRRLRKIAKAPAPKDASSKVRS